MDQVLSIKIITHSTVNEEIGSGDLSMKICDLIVVLKILDFSFVFILLQHIITDNCIKHFVVGFELL